MNPKVSNYLLIGGAILVWGIIIVRVLKGLQGDEPLNLATRKITPIDYKIIKDSFTISANYPDPFLAADGESATDDSPPLEKQPILKKLMASENGPEIDVNSIQFRGMIYNPERKKKVAMVSIAGLDYLLREKEKIRGLVISKITADEITITLKGQTIKLPRNAN